MGRMGCVMPATIVITFVYGCGTGNTRYCVHGQLLDAGTQAPLAGVPVIVEVGVRSVPRGDSAVFGGETDEKGKFEVTVMGDTRFGVVWILGFLVYTPLGACGPPAPDAVDHVFLQVKRGVGWVTLDLPVKASQQGRVEAPVRWIELGEVAVGRRDE